MHATAELLRLTGAEAVATAMPQNDEMSLRSTFGTCPCWQQVANEVQVPKTMFAAAHNHAVRVCKAQGDLVGHAGVM